MKQKVFTFIKSILVPLVLGGIVGFILSKSMDYDSLIQPPLAPPAILFPIVWTILYILMGVSYGILKVNEKVDTKVSLIYYLQLIVNLLWPIAFFVFKWRLFAFFWIILLLVLVVVMTVSFYKRNKLAGILQLPYIFWTIFATYLNLAIYILNG